MGLAPSEFYRLLYSELILILEGYRARYQRETRERREESAWMVSWLLLPHKSKDADEEVFSPDWLMGCKRHSKPTPAFANDEDKARALVTAFRAKSKQKRLTDGK
jgi:hypothetical protein